MYCTLYYALDDVTNKLQSKVVNSFVRPPYIISKLSCTGVVFLPEIIHNIILQLIKFGLKSLVLTIAYKRVRYVLRNDNRKTFPLSVAIHSIVATDAIRYDIRRRFYWTSHREIVFKFKNENLYIYNI